MTRKLVLGMLMTLVLAFSVQGIADALTFGTSRSGDLATELPVPNDFTIRFSVTPKGNTNIENANGDRVDEAENLINSSGYYINADGDYVTTPGGSTVATTTAERVRANDSVRYHYSDEQITITVTNAEITKVGSHDITDTASHVLMEMGEDEDRLTSSNTTLTLEASGPEVVVITIADTTPADDLPNGEADRAPAITFTVYVVPGTAPAAELALAGTGTDGIDIGNDFGVQRIDGLFNATENVPLTYQVEGSGRVFVELGDSKTSETNKLETSSSAPVYLDMKRSSNKVTVWVRGQDAKRNSVSVTFVNEYADPQITGGDNQRGATNGRLADPLEVTVRDSKGRAIPGGVVVGFASTATGSMFIPVSGTTVYISDEDALVLTAPTTPDALTTIATSSTPGPAGSIFVKTDSSGKAKTYFQLGSETQQRVTITLPGTGATYLNTFFRRRQQQV